MGSHILHVSTVSRTRTRTLVMVDFVFFQFILISVNEEKVALWICVFLAFCEIFPRKFLESFGKRISAFFSLKTFANDCVLSRYSSFFRARIYSSWVCLRKWVELHLIVCIDLIFAAKPSVKPYKLPYRFIVLSFTETRFHMLNVKKKWSKSTVTNVHVHIYVCGMPIFVSALFTASQSNIFFSCMYIVQCTLFKCFNVQPGRNTRKTTEKEEMWIFRIDLN